MAKCDWKEIITEELYAKIAKNNPVIQKDLKAVTLLQDDDACRLLRKGACRVRGVKKRTSIGSYAQFHATDLGTDNLNKKNTNKEPSLTIKQFYKKEKISGGHKSNFDEPFYWTLEKFHDNEKRHKITSSDREDDKTDFDDNCHIYEEIWSK